MTLQELFDTINTVLNKHQSGNTLTPSEFNRLLEANIFSFVRGQIMSYRQYVKSGVMSDDVVLSGLLLDSLQKKTTASLGSGYFTLATDTLMVNSLSGTYSSKYKKIDLVSPEEYAARMQNLLSKPVAYFPVAYIVGTRCYVYPTNMTSLVVEYIAKPTIPVYDYYIDANYNIQYLAVSATRTLTDGEYGSAGQTLGTTVTSTSVELDIPEDTHAKFAEYLISKVAMRDRDAALYQANENEIAK